MAISRQRVIAEARSWVGTPFQHHGRVKGVACDCVGLPIMVGKALGVQSRVAGADLDENKNYGPQPKGREVLEAAKKHLIAKPIAHLKPGDVLVLRMPTSPCHTAIVGEWNGLPTLIHAYNRIRDKVIEHHLDTYWRKYIAACFEFPGVED